MKAAFKKQKWQAIDWEKILSEHKSGKGLIYRP